VEPNRYIVALRRDQQADAPSDWVDRIGALEGVSVVGTTGKRAQVAADDDGLRRLRDELGSFTHIEPIIEHHRS
jgi:hypothetical protein